MQSYVMALCLIAVFLTFSHTMSMMALDSARYDANVINVSGRQRMLSQRILYLALEEMERPSEGTRRALASSVDEFSSAHEQLSGMARKSTVLIAAYFSRADSESLDSIVQDFLKDATEIAEQELDRAGEMGETMARLSLLGTDQLLAKLETAVAAHETVALKNSQRLKTLENASLIAAGVILLLEALFIFWPALRQTRRAFLSLEAANANKDAAIKRLVEFSEISADLFWETDVEGRILYISGRLLPDLSFEEDPFVGEYYNAILGFGPREQNIMRQMLATQRPYEGILANFSDHKGRRYKISLSGRPHHDAEGRLTGYIGVGDDVTQEVAEQEKIRSLAERDALTGLFNRHAFNHRLKRQMSISMASGNSTCLLALDLDGFKAINDTHGHDAGDELLKQVASRLQGKLGQRGWAARLGGDEFMVVCKSSLNDGDLKILAIELNEALAEPHKIGSQSLSIGVSIGIAVAPRDARTMDELVKCADIALYEAKWGGRSGHRMYDAKMTVDSDRQKELEAGLRKTLQEDGLEVVFQPIINLETRTLSGFEALARWEDAELGVIPPAQFVGIAEAGGFMPMLGHQILQKACRAAANWPSSPSHPNPHVSVNIAAAEIVEPGFTKRVTSILAETGLEATRLELEITNSLMLDQSAEAINTLQELKDLGIQLSIDDFGTGQTSLSQLRLLPLSRIKIDRTFISEMTHDQNSMKIIRGMIGLSRDLNLSILAEGVETERQAALLIAAGCKEAQGHYFSKALAEADVRRMLQQYIATESRTQLVS
jgi:diguanylate cyclase (GGDEF)-like protein/PAS domain S-box-containing protein